MKKLLLSLIFSLLITTSAIAQVCVPPEKAAIIFLEKNPGSHFIKQWSNEKAELFSKWLSSLPPVSKEVYSQIFILTNPAFAVDLIVLFKGDCLFEFFPIPKALTDQAIKAVEGIKT